ncbi:DUF2934 domain-containing protein [Mesorhizobium caraganae]|uniref:DUF2934 domain-containing protein n=1 Tax=Mesorhizobium caraganae TaxID=483206 RepID=A0ABV1YZV8_9HYPH
MSEDRNERIRRRAYEIWQREGAAHGEHERHWHQASAEIDREDNELGARPGIAPGAAMPGAVTIPSGRSDVLSVEALAMKTGITGDQAQELIDRIGDDNQALEQAAMNRKVTGTSPRQEGKKRSAR